jgi:hypothetical protein
MITFELQCSNGHNFEGWFDDRKAYETQLRKSLIACPVCSDTSISRVFSSFAIKSSASSTLTPREQQSQMDLEKLGKKIIDYVEKNFENVGADFTKEALKIHYGISEPKNIRGVSSPEEEKMLKEEGVEFYKIPVPAAQDGDS